MIVKAVVSAIISFITTTIIYGVFKAFGVRPEDLVAKLINDPPIWLTSQTVQGKFYLVTGISIFIIIFLFWNRPRQQSQPTYATSSGGAGGNATVGGSGMAVGGKGGNSGAPGAGTGGAGGSAHVEGDGFAMGGEGGEAGQADRPGRGGRGPAEVLGLPNITLPDGSRLWDYGRGGDGAGPIQSNGPNQDKSNEK